MINANEIRLGNLYNRKHGKGWTQTECTEYMLGKIFSSDNEFALDDFEPIPLTPEWLISLGFEKDGFGAYNKKLSLVEGHFKMLVFAGDYLYQREGIQEKRRETDDICVLWNKDYMKQFYVHQLQNLFYDLTREELRMLELA